MLSLTQRALTCCVMKFGPNSLFTRKEHCPCDCSSSQSLVHLPHSPPALSRGIDHLKDPRLNKGLAYTMEERQCLGLQGLLACAVQDLETQVKICQFYCKRLKLPLDKYIYLVGLQESNERLFFNLLASDIQTYMPLMYTPTVGLACQKYGIAYRRPKGLFISIHDKGHIREILANWPERDIRAICFTDGERILGLGDLGAQGMGIPVGKLILYTALAGVKPHWCLPVTLDVGTNNKTLLEDPLYIGIRQKRTRGKEYYDFIEEFMAAAADTFGPQILLQFEDFAYANAAPLLARFKDRYTSFNDDIQGTASVAVAGLIAATRITKKKISENIFMFLGAGSASLGIADLLMAAMLEEGLSEADGVKKIFMCDIDGLVTSKRESGVPEFAKRYGKDLPAEKNFETNVANVKPTCLVGCSTVGGAFTPAILKMMSKNAERPIIFAMSNPTQKAECTAQQAYDNTEGACIFASGSPFPPVKYNGKEYFTGQGNNSYIFPGVSLGVILCKSTIVTETMFLTAAKTVAEMVHQKDLDIGRIYPSFEDIMEVSFTICENVMEHCYEKEYATLHPRPKDLRKFIEDHTYNLDYPDHLPQLYDFPKLSGNVKSIEEVHQSELSGSGTKAPSAGSCKPPPNPCCK